MSKWLDFAALYYLSEGDSFMLEDGNTYRFAESGILNLKGKREEWLALSMAIGDIDCLSPLSGNKLKLPNRMEQIVEMLNMNFEEVYIIKEYNRTIEFKMDREKGISLIHSTITSNQYETECRIFNSLIEGDLKVISKNTDKEKESLIILAIIGTIAAILKLNWLVVYSIVCFIFCVFDIIKKK